MAKLALIFIAVFFFIQLTMAQEVTTPNILDSIKSGIENTFSEQNIRDGITKLNEFGQKATDLGKKVVSNFQNVLSETTAAPAS